MAHQNKHTPVEVRPETETRALEPYAMLSHIWEDEEVTFQELDNLKEARLEKGVHEDRENMRTRQESGPAPTLRLG